MKEFERAWYEKAFELSFYKKNGDEFQDFFSDIMEKGHGTDFQRIRPWGKTGDKKNDGYLKSSKTVFQVYAPNDMTSADAIAKIEEDFKGAQKHWSADMSRWIFVHNSKQGLGPDVHKKLLASAKNRAGIEVTAWGFEELRKQTLSLNDQDLAALLGPCPTRADVVKLGFQDLEVVLLSVAQEATRPDSDIRPVPADKLAANGLSANTAILLTAGMVKARLVSDFFSRYYDPTLGDRVAEAFNSEYNLVRHQGYSADRIFSHLLAFAGGAQRGSSSHEAAVLAVIAHLFEQCDIFEAPRSDS